MFSEIIENQPGIDAVYEKFIAAPRRAKAAARTPQSNASYTVRPVSLDDDALIEKALRAKAGESLKRLLDGDWSGYRSQSEADQALCNRLAFWMGKDPARMDRIFRTSGLYREKWDERHGARSYGEMTIARAIEGTGEVYQERRPQQRRPQPNTSSNSHSESAVNEEAIAVDFAAEHKEHLRFCEELGAWLEWNPSVASLI